MSRARGALLVALLVGCAVTAAPAQESFFSLQFLGASEESAGGRARGLGIQGIALDDPRTSLALNPAALGGLKYMTFSAVGVAGVRTSSDSTLEQRAGLARFPHVRVALPLFGRVVASVGFAGMRNFRADFQLPERTVDGRLEHRQRFARDGTLYRIPVGLSGTFGSRLRLGATWDFVLGTVDERWVTEGDSIIALTSRRRDEMTGQTATLGVVARPFGSLRIGLTWSPQFDINRSRRITLEDARANTAAAPIRDTSEKGTFTYPQVLRAGAAVDLGPAWTVAGDYMWREWESYTGDRYEAEAIGNETRFGGGLEWTPQPRMYYRVGASRSTWPHLVGGNRLHETAIHLGLGIDVKVDGGRFDVSLEHAWTGNLDRNVKGEERSWRVVVSLAGQEEWRRKSPRTR
jgi:hypothetical protein